MEKLCRDYCREVEALHKAPVSGGLPLFCIDWRHPKHMFGDMVNTFSAGDTFRLERSREDAVESEFYHVSTSRIRFISQSTKGQHARLVSAVWDQLRHCL